jgi:peptidoglycan/LPS O-acetylase OafA/YrhL
LNHENVPGGIFDVPTRCFNMRSKRLSTLSTAYRPDVDGLRAVAILLVLIFHFNLFAIGKAGFLGVDVFFVISGYLISGLIWRGLDAGRFSLGVFYLRRLRRLAPALLVTQAMVMIVALVLFMPIELMAVAQENLATSFYVSNVYYWRNLDYFGLQASQSILLHTWSLAIEEQFYLLYPLLLVLIHRFARRYFLGILLALVMLSFAANIALVDAKPWAAFYLLPTRAWELGLGALILFLEPRFAATAKLRWAASFAGPVMIGLGIVLFTPETAFPGAFALLPTLGSALIILAGTGAGSPVSRLLSSALPVALGQISYSLYLVHWPLRTLGERLLPHYGMVERWSLFATSILLAIIVYRAVENPVRQGRLLTAPKAFIVAMTSAVILMIGLSVVVLQSKGWPQRFNNKVVAIAAVETDVDPDRAIWESGNDKSGTPKFRPVGDPSRLPSWLIAGDSHASALTGAVDLWLKGRGEGGLIVFRHGCMPVLETGDTACRAFNASIQQRVRERGTIRNVLMISIWRQAIGATGFEAHLAATLKDYRAAGVDVHVWEPLPSTLRSVPAALARDATFGPYWPIARTTADHRATFAFFRDILDRNAVQITTRIDPAVAMCRGPNCIVTVGGWPLYTDNSHVAWHASPFFAAILEQGTRTVPTARDMTSYVNSGRKRQ